MRSDYLNDNSSVSNLDLKIKKVKNRDKSTHQFFHDEHINLNNGIKYLGLTIHNSRTKNDKGNWEIFLNNSELDSKDQFIYTALHEIGHTLGLEHPHSDSDGDFYRTTSAQNSASPSQTIMPYFMECSINKLIFAV
jgi:Zn-dependent peptidase ImmA (M78 family)